MITCVVQRWLRRCATYRPAGETFDPKGHEVASIADDRTPRAFVEEHHYSASYPAARFRFGLYEGAELVGVAVFSVPMHPAVLRPFAPDASAELGRFVLLDRVRANGESWFLARCLAAVRREGLDGIVSFSDPEPRANGAGDVVFRGHVGTIYQATNATYQGRAKPKTEHLFPDGTVFSNRAASKIRQGHRGQRYAIEQLVAAGAPPPSNDGDPRAWLRMALALTTRTVRHGGNHKYLFALNESAKKRLPEGKPYPKFHGACAARPRKSRSCGAPRSRFETTGESR